MDPNNPSQPENPNLNKLESDLAKLSQEASAAQSTETPVVPPSVPVTTPPAPVETSTPPTPVVTTPPVETPKSGGKPSPLLMSAVVLALIAVLAVLGYVVWTRVLNSDQAVQTPQPRVVATPTVTPLVSPSASPSGTPIATSSASPISDKTIIINGSPAFSPNSLTVKAGATVNVTNKDTMSHTLTADDGSFDTGVLSKDKTGTFVAPSKPGTYKFHCSIHSSMTGTLVVE